ncbi:c-type cytochrome [Roseospira visakhapatnamensis]|uniref:Sulfide dehydrogenase cytochrome subunit n=1 Tax=Roseospira visakhapatnamensis TaxID=390880 RepID=A0A7W6RAU8_9PROT|nr:c-type cytochrome [Roseospira visakhapatnamensis]MBB4265087.1 sulfide dehydrogenase cytochrome subunit [Roseospira visakhapatnamensis]
MHISKRGQRRLGLATLTVGLAAAAAPALGDEPAVDHALEIMAGSCTFCHGPNGVGVGPAVPTISGLHAEQFAYMMRTYQDDTNPSTVMGRIARGFSEDEIEQLAVYFEGLPFERPAQPAIDMAMAAEGKELAAEYCESCHENEGRDGEGVGILAGQKLVYMRYAVEDFLEGHRDMERRQARKFRELMDAHGMEGFEKTLHYYASVK